MNLRQSAWGSFGEAAVNTFAGFGLSLFLQWLYFDWWLGFPLHFTDNLTFAAIMTAVSLGRGFSVRRIAERLGLRARLSPSMQALIAERLRQPAQEGFDAAHDDAHDAGELALAAACYAIHAATGGYWDAPPSFWPWEPKWWKPQGVWRDLTRAGALILAEMDRALRRRNRRRPWRRANATDPLAVAAAGVHVGMPRGPAVRRAAWPRSTNKVQR